MNRNTISRRLLESLSLDADITSKDYVLSLYSKIINKYIDKFKSTGSAEELYNEYNDNNLRGGLDFCVASQHTFGASSEPENLDGFLDVKRGCWLNSLDFMNKYGDGYPEYSLAHGIIIRMSDLEKAEKNLDENKIPLKINMIMHGFIVKDDGSIFDPTLGINTKYHYFYERVPEEVWKAFDYKYQDDGNWEVKTFSEYTKIHIMDHRSEGFKFIV